MGDYFVPGGRDSRQERWWLGMFERKLYQVGGGGGILRCSASQRVQCTTEKPKTCKKIIFSKSNSNISWYKVCIKSCFIRKIFVWSPCFPTVQWWKGSQVEGRGCCECTLLSVRASAGRQQHRPERDWWSSLDIIITSSSDDSDVISDSVTQVIPVMLSSMVTRGCGWFSWHIIGSGLPRAVSSG